MVNVVNNDEEFHQIDFNEYLMTSYGSVNETIAIENAVDHPKHYNHGNKYEPIDVIDDWNLDFCLGNVVKYISRCGHKDNPIQELKKAKFYLSYEIKKMEERSMCDEKSKKA